MVRVISSFSPNTWTPQALSLTWLHGMTYQANTPPGQAYYEDIQRAFQTLQGLFRASWKMAQPGAQRLWLIQLAPEILDEKPAGASCLRQNGKGEALGRNEAIIPSHE